MAGGELIGRFRELIELGSQLKDLLPLLMDLIECFKGMTPAQQAHTAQILANRIYEGDQAKQQAFVSQVQRLTA